MIITSIQVTLDADHPLYARFVDIYKVFAALIFAAVNVGLTSSLAPDYAKAKLAARKIYGVMNRQPKIDGYSEEGTKLVSLRRYSFCDPFTEVCRFVVQCNRKMGVDSSNSVNC